MKQVETLMYKGKPIARQGRFVFYGDPRDKAILFMNIMETVADGDLQVASKVLVQIQKTDNNVGFKEKIIKQCEKKSFYEALDIGMIWLDRELKK